MMEGAADIASWALLLGGSFFCLSGGIGLLRLPDFFSRIHGAGLTDTLGAGLILGGLILQSGLSLNAAKLAFILFFLLLTSPTATHALAQAALGAGLKPRLAPDNTTGAQKPNAANDSPKKYGEAGEA